MIDTCSLPVFGFLLPRQLARLSGQVDPGDDRASKIVNKIQKLVM
jgi:hypothetical protein